MSGVEIDHDHAAIGREEAQDFVGDVARMVAQRAGIRVGKDDRRAGRGDRLAHHVGRDVAQVEQHAEAIHFADDREAKRGQSVVNRIVGRAVGPIVILEMGQRHIARAKRVKAAQRGEIIADVVATLHPDQRGDASGAVDTADIIGGGGEFEIARVGGDQTLDDVDLLERFADRGIAGDLRRDVDRPELSPDAPGAEAGDVGHQWLGEPIGAAGKTGDAHAIFLAQLPREIIVAIDQRGLLENMVDSSGDFRVDRLGMERGRGNERGRDQQGSPHEFPPSASATGFTGRVPAAQ